MADSKDLVLMPVDASPHSDVAFDFYADNIHGPNKTLVLLHCQEISNLHHKEGSHLHHKDSSDHTPHYDKWVKLQQEQEEAADELRRKYQQKLVQRQIDGEWTVVPSNKPGETIVAEASRSQAALLVVGSRGLGSLRRTILGSVSDYVLHHATCPVIITRH